MKLVAFFKVKPSELDKFIEKQSERALNEKNIKVVLRPHTLAEPYDGVTGFVVIEAEFEHFGEVRNYLRRNITAGAEVKISPIMDDSKLAKELVKFKKGKEKVESEWQRTSFNKIKDIGTTKRLEVLPLIDWQKKRDDLKVETAVSYLVRTDEQTILFDLGMNAGDKDPSSLMHNMAQLGIKMDDVDTIFISHNHGDHVGGGKWAKEKTFSPSGRQIDLSGKRVYTPVPMTYPGLSPIHSEKPMVIGKGVATIGTISNQIFFMGRTPEQALAVNVEGKGIVLIVGCGHQTLPKIISRAKSLLDEPLYGLLGGLHYPVEGGPVEIMGMAYHKYVGTGKLPWDPIRAEELKGYIELLKKLGLKVLGLSSHDSSKLSLDAFREAFPDSYREITVGEPITI